MTPAECGAVVKYMLAGFPAQRQKMRDEDITAMTAFYYAGLADLDAAVVKKAIERVARTAEFIPTVAVIRKAVGVVHHGEESAAAIAWGEVHRFMGSKGAYRTPGVDFEFSDPLVAKIVRSIGWESMCTGATDHIRARFMDAYEQTQKIERAAAQVATGGKNAELGAARPRATIERQGTHASLGQLVAMVRPDGEPCESPCGDESCGKSGAWCKKGPAR